jgi:hypothetical protein
MKIVGSRKRKKIKIKKKKVQKLFLECNSIKERKWENTVNCVNFPKKKDKMGCN